MAVVVQYIVVRNGEQKMTFTSKKEADAYDKILDIAERLLGFLQTAGLEVEVGRLEEMAFYLAENREAAMTLLRGGSLKTELPVGAAKPASASGRKAPKVKKTALENAAAAGD
ncbi:MAG: YebG family protein [Deltaproteobacteria bacterium]|nr:YebG family protein [Deltaproteobacteria bacterium]